MNFQKIKTLEGGWSTDVKDNVERKNTFQKAVNGRLYSRNGVLSFSSVEGSRLIYENNQIVKYLGYYSFRDELIVFAKCLKGTSGGITENEVCETVIDSDTFAIGVDAATSGPVSINNHFSDNSVEQENCYTVTLPPENETNFDLAFSCDDSSEIEVDFGEYYGTYLGVPNFQTCSLNLSETPINNQEYLDCIYSLKHDENFNLIGTLLWVGAQNWPLNGKITTEGVEENEFYKRVYYTDAINPRRVVNIKDPSLIYRAGDEFNQVLNNILLQPEIQQITDGGQLKAMKSLYLYRIISENGQVSEFSPSSFFADIIPEEEPIRYRGGDVSEITNKRVRIKCNIIDPEASAEVECVAVEYEAFGPPTAIRNLGRKPANNVVEFDHFGSEDEFSDDITINDILDFTNTWKYCNDFTSKKNKLVAVGLRNDPVPTDINNLQYLFPLHSWDAQGNTHDCLMNPRPWEYRYIDPSNDDNLIYIKQKVYRTISSFGPLTLTFRNTETDESISINFDDLSLENYTNITTQVEVWLNDQKANNPDFNNFFPNLDISNVNGQLLLSPTDENIQTDMANYVFESNNNQFIENFDNDIVFLNVNVNTGNLVYGAKSIGFDQGVGIRVTYREFKEPLLNQATEIYDGTGTLLDYYKPSGEKFCMKGEIYRLAFQAYNNDSTRYFSIPIGDVMIPNLGDIKSEIDDSGNAIITSQAYVNQSVENGVLYGHGIKMHFEVRLSCALQERIPMYQMLYVERHENNRTILCQGISAPLTRLQHSGSSSHVIPEVCKNKWNLPYYGGPTYERRGLLNFDTYGENNQYFGEQPERRTMTHRGLMYFDSPDLYFNKISDQFVNNSKVDIVAKLNTDHTPGVIRERGGGFRIENPFGDEDFFINFGNEVYPKFSRKILEGQIEGNNNSGSLPRAAREDRESGTYEAHFINVSVFANYQPHNDQIEIDAAESLNRGEVISGAAFNIDNDVSNNTFCLPNQPWYYGWYQRKWTFQSGRPNSTVFRSSVTSPGYKTTIIKTVDNLFTDDFIGPIIHRVDSQVRLGGSNHGVFDTIPLINLFRDNRESVYGGRTEQAYSRNTYIPLSKTIPTLKSSNATQFFDAGADTYVTLNIRVKNDYGDDQLFERDMNNHGGARAKGDIKAWERNGAWCYAVVLESQVEPKYPYQYEFYRESGTHSFQATRGEIINEAYFNENTLKNFIPQPFKYRDDPNQGNVIAVSDVKLAGELYDSWTVFQPNNFYAELEKNKGDISNVLKEDDQIFAIQEEQTSLIYLGTDRIISDSEGSPINLQQGSGSVVEGHKIISPYGTSIRRAAVESDYGFCFFDPRKIEFVKIKNPLFTENFLHLDCLKIFKNNPVIDSEAYFDHEHKETNIRVRTRNGNAYLFSYNEILKVFNGEIEYNNDLYMMFDEKVYAPITTNPTEQTVLSKDLHQLNEGDPLNLFNQQKTMKLGIYVNADIDKVFQYKTWGAVCNINYPFKQIFFRSNLGYDRTILGTHNWYKIREGNHTVPAINETNDVFNISDIRGNWVYVEMEVESLNRNKVDILAVLNSLRVSHQ